MLNPGGKIYLCTGYTDMRKGINGLSIMVGSIIPDSVFSSGAVFVFRGRSADKVKILWWDGQGFCLFYKCLDVGAFPWSNRGSGEAIVITKGQLSMLLEGIDWRTPKWSKPPIYAG